MLGIMRLGLLSVLIICCNETASQVTNNSKGSKENSTLDATPLGRILDTDQ